MHYLRNFWYVAALSRDVGMDLLGQQILGERVLLYRKLDGTPVAMQDRCIHRGISLSSGTRIGDDVRCGYHGLRYDTTGRCIHIPGQKHIPAKACVRTYPLAERDGLVWIWTGDSKADVPYDQVPDFSKFDAPGNWRSWKQSYERASPVFGIENALDMSHIAYVHHKLFTNDIVTDFPVDLRVEGDRVTVKRSEFDIPAPPLFREVMGLTGNTDRSQEVQYWPPFNILLHSMVRPAGSTDPAQTRNMYIYAGCTPDSLKSFHLFTLISRDYLADNKEVSEYFDRQLFSALDEDIAIIEEQQRNWDQDGANSPMINTSLDGSSMAARKILARLFREQNGGVDVPMPWCHVHRLNEVRGVVEESTLIARKTDT